VEGLGIGILLQRHLQLLAVWGGFRVVAARIALAATVITPACNENHQQQPRSSLPAIRCV